MTQEPYASAASMQGTVPLTPTSVFSPAEEENKVNEIEISQFLDTLALMDEVSAPEMDDFIAHILADLSWL